MLGLTMGSLASTAISPLSSGANGGKGFAALVSSGTMVGRDGVLILCFQGGWMFLAV
jgi:hypothetical protein